MRNDVGSLPLLETLAKPSTSEEAELFAGIGELLRLRAGLHTGLERRKANEIDRRIRALVNDYRRLRDRNRLWGAAEPLLNHRAEAMGLSPEEARRSSRLEALLALPALCRRDGIKIRFSGTPRTDGKTIWLGSVDLSHPAAPVYVFGHGIHERTHVLHTDFRGAEGLSQRAFALTNLFEDVRIDAIGESECRGYRFWREALLALLCRTGEAVFLSDDPMRPASEVFLAWLHAELLEKMLQMKLPDGILEAVRLEASRRFGRAFLKDALGLALRRFPLSSTFDAAALAIEFEEFLSDAALVEARVEREVERERETRASKQGVRQRDCEKSRRISNGEGIALSLFDDGSLTSGASPARSSPKRDVYPAVLRLSDERNWRGNSRPLEGGLAMERLEELISLPESAMPDIEAVEETHAETLRRHENVPEGSGNASGGLLPRLAKLSDIRTAQKAFDAAWDETSPFAMGLADLLKRRLPADEGGARTGFDIDDREVDRALTGDDRIFVREGKRKARKIACEILLDLSGSLGERGGAVLRAAAARLEGGLKRLPGAAARTAVFPNERGTGPFLASDWKSSSLETRGILRAMPSRGPTPVGQSLLWALQTLASRPEPAKLLFLLTDGVFDAGEYRGEVEALAMAGIELATLVLCDPDLPEAEIGPRNAIGSETRFVRSIDEIPEAIHGLLLGLKKRDAF
ncbi:hypothetical protein FG381_01225 [Sutterella faecalis]|uniref:VWFA domain-containing protein n=2 Tax=Sutterella TaxID=40544 RepID=A0AAI9SAG5_9BURK|nr:MULTISPECIES: hypothetical protein [Sutterella]KAB7650331.1 hypothetical protein GBM96_09295 [Sutterella seckii]QDA53670.1 hypothetical protein FG381_01225 [Sutterella faecalis]